MKLKNSDIVIKKVKHEDLQKMYYGDKNANGEYVEGFYNPTNNTIYISKKSNIETIYHEIAHAVFQKYYYNAVINLVNDTNITCALQEIIADCASNVLKVVSDNDDKLRKTINKENKNDKEKK